MELICDLSVMTPDERERHQHTYQQLQDRLLSIEELPEGYSLHFPGDTATYRLLVDFVQFERLCCPFFHFTIESEPAQQKLTLALTGSAEVKQFAKAELGLNAG
jgi:hypothetical protein